MGILSAFAVIALPQQSPEAPAGFDNQSNGLVDPESHAIDQAAFEKVLGIADGLGPLYNAQSCGECHHNPDFRGGEPGHRFARGPS